MDAKLHTLHRYWIWANRLHQNFDAALERFGVPKADGVGLVGWFANDPGLFMSYWYAALFVVVEGFKELNLRDAKLDALLQSPNVEFLRRYRNGVDHFQEDYFDRRFTEIMGPPESATWVRNLHSEFGRFFLEQFAGTGGSSGPTDQRIGD